MHTRFLAAVAFPLLSAAAQAASPVGAEASFPEPGRAVVSFDVPAGHELFPDSLRARLEPGGAALETGALPPVSGEDPLGRGYATGSFSVAFSSDGPFPEGAELAVSFQACGPATCYPPETRRFAVPGAPAAGTPAAPDGAPAEAEPEVGYRLPRLDDMSVLSSAAGFLGPEEYLAMLRGERREPGLLERARARGGAALLFLALLLGGFLLDLTPCVLPLVPVNLALLGAGAGRASRRRGFALGAAFGLGTAVAFGALGLFSALTGRAFGALHASPVFHAAAAIVFCALALAMLDVLRVDLSSLRNVLRRRRGRPAASASAPRAGRGVLPFARAFAAGAGSALLSGACVAPVLGAALVLAADLVRGGRPAGALVPFALGLGMGLPWPFLGAGFAALPKPGRWMERVKRLFAAVFLVAAAVYAVQSWRLLFRDVRRPPSAGPVEWTTDESAAVIVAQAAEGPLVLDLTADWCRSCREMERTTFSDPDVARELSRFPSRLRLDCTDADDPGVRRVMDFLGASGFPFSAVLVPKPAAPAP